MSFYQLLCNSLHSLTFLFCSRRRFKDVVEAYQKTLEMDQAGEVDSGVGEEMEKPQSIAKIKNAPTFDRTAEVVPRAPLPCRFSSPPFRRLFSELRACSR